MGMENEFGPCRVNGSAAGGTGEMKVVDADDNEEEILKEETTVISIAM